MNDLRHWRTSTREFNGGRDRGRRNTYIFAVLLLVLAVVGVMAIAKYGVQ